MNETIVGTVLNVTVKLLKLVAVPTPLVTVMRPVVAFGGTIAVIWVGEFTT